MMILPNFYSKMKITCKKYEISDKKAMRFSVCELTWKPEANIL